MCLVVGAIHGAALGTGRLRSPLPATSSSLPRKTRGFGLPELTVGVMGGARHLARMAPQPLVRRMFFTGEPLSAKEFADAGGAIFVRGSGQFLAEAKRLAARIASLSPTAVRVGKRILDRVEWMDLRKGYEFEQAASAAYERPPQLTATF